MTYSVVGIGTSWGGLAAMTKLLGGLPADFSLPVVVVQHRGKDSDRLLSELLQDATDMRVCEIEDKEPLEPGTVHIAPANYHVLIDAGYLSLSVEEPVRFSRPSIDVMLNSAADTYGSGAIGVVLTGANEDGSRGLSHIVKRGGRALVQDPKTAEIPIMPAAALKAVPTAEVLPLDALAPRLIALSQDRAVAGVRKAV
ncbi:MAG: two-component system, chemotaxis family, protein-glutamate methylesterase/glutaminase [Gemmatimonadaceae bacterium]|jgi:two-component system chemotaxis response regulator CheB|nr:two-component system, chemotaxis family, protein-glutamate methylesterase/glutaminase [Gemmatimonadaceae bacterium]